MLHRSYVIDEEDDMTISIASNIWRKSFNSKLRMNSGVNRRISSQSCIWCELLNKKLLLWKWRCCVQRKKLFDSIRRRKAHQLMPIVSIMEKSDNRRRIVQNTSISWKTTKLDFLSSCTYLGKLDLFFKNKI